jgi:hypothetical protein
MMRGRAWRAIVVIQFVGSKSEARRAQRVLVARGGYRELLDKADVVLSYLPTGDEWSNLQLSINQDKNVVPVTLGGTRYRTKCHYTQKSPRSWLTPTPSSSSVGAVDHSKRYLPMDFGSHESRAHDQNNIGCADLNGRSLLIDGVNSIVVACVVNEKKQRMRYSTDPNRFVPPAFHRVIGSPPLQGMNFLP